jgi:hypothetical protein
VRLPTTIQSLAAMAIPDLFPHETRGSYRCVDGPVGLADIARAAGCSAKKARRAIQAYVDRHEAEGRTDAAGAVLNVTEDDVPPEGHGTRADVARVIAKRIGAGRYGLQNRIAERAATRPPAKPKEKRVSTQQHPWKVETHGRSVKGKEGGGIVATLACEHRDCSTTETIPFRQLCGSVDMDRKFQQRGWAVDPAKCPAHNRRNHQTPKETPVATAAKTSPAAIAAQARMFGLLQTHFDVERGCYGGGYSDAKIADECGLAPDLVAGVRAQAFGDLKEPAEIAQLASDIEALSALIDEQVAPLRTELANLRSKLAEVRRKFAA